MPKFTTDQLRKLRDDFGFFCHLVLGRPPNPRQLEVFTSPARICVFVAGRGCGKTVCAVAYALWRCMREPKHVVVWGSSAEEQAELGGDILRDLLDGPLEAYVVERSVGRVRFDNGSVIHFVPNSPRRARGFHNKWIEDYTIRETNLLKRVAKARRRAPSITLVLDESQDVSEAVYTAALGVLSASSDSRAIFAGSAKGRDSWFYKEYLAGLEGDGETKSFLISAEDCDWIDQKLLAAYRTKLDPDTYAAEYCGVFMDAVSSYFTAEMIADATEEYEVPLPYDEDYQYVVSVDLAPSERYGSDYAVVAVLGRHFGGFKPDYYESVVSCTTGHSFQRPSRTGETIEPHVKVFYLSRHQTLDHEGLRRELETVKHLYPGCDRGIAESYESMQFDAICYQVIRRGQDNEKLTRYGRGDVQIAVEVLNPSNPTQHEAFSNLHRLIREGELLLPDTGAPAKVLRQELLHLQKEITPAGNVRWQAAKGFHDDCVYALLWGCYALRQERYRGPFAILKDGTFV